MPFFSKNQIKSNCIFNICTFSQHSTCENWKIESARAKSYWRIRCACSNQLHDRQLVVDHCDPAGLIYADNMVSVIDSIMARVHSFFPFNISCWRWAIDAFVFGQLISIWKKMVYRMILQFMVFNWKRIIYFSIVDWFIYLLLLTQSFKMYVWFHFLFFTHFDLERQCVCKAAMKNAAFTAADHIFYVTIHEYPGNSLRLASKIKKIPPCGGFTCEWSIDCDVKHRTIS